MACLYLQCPSGVMQFVTVLAAPHSFIRAATCTLATNLIRACETLHAVCSQARPHCFVWLLYTLSHNPLHIKAHTPRSKGCSLHFPFRDSRRTHFSPLQCTRCLIFMCSPALLFAACCGTAAHTNPYSFAMRALCLTLCVHQHFVFPLSTPAKSARAPHPSSLLLWL
jgi:hypothetical protein